MKTFLMLNAIGLLVLLSSAAALAEEHHDCALPKGTFKIDYERSIKGSWTPPGISGMPRPLSPQAIDESAERNWVAVNHTPYPRYTLQPTQDCSTLRFYYPLPDEAHGATHFRAPTDAECNESASLGLSSIETPFFVCIDFKVYKDRKEAEGKPKPHAYWDNRKLVTQEVTRWGKAPFSWNFSTEGKRVTGYYKMSAPAAWSQAPTTEARNGTQRKAFANPWPRRRGVRVKSRPSRRWIEADLSYGNQKAAESWARPLPVHMRSLPKRDIMMMYRGILCFLGDVRERPVSGSWPA